VALHVFVDKAPRAEAEDAYCTVAELLTQHGTDSGLTVI
jgi:hypothetical protein